MSATVTIERKASLEVTYTYRCQLVGCPSEDNQTQKLGLGWVKMEPCPPVGWFQVCGLLICSKHRLEVRCDGEAVIR